MMPVRRVEKSKRLNSGWSSWAINMVGTPCRAVQRSSLAACMVASGSKASPGNTMQAPTETQASTDSTMPKQ
ncbi:hypothetical protein D3C72_1592130 [compost metagenome]